MNKQRLMALIRTSLLYTNPQYTEQSRVKGKSGEKLIRGIVLQYVFVGLIFTLLYGGMLFSVDFSKLPGYFTLYVGLFGLLTLSQGISVIYNVFFESKDLGAYLPLPFRQGEIFLAKILVVTLTVIPYILPLLVLFVLTAWQSNRLVILAFILGMLGFVLFLGIVLFLSALIVLGLTRMKFFQTHKKLMTTGLMFFTTILAVVGILFMQLSDTTEYSETSLTLIDRSEIIPFSPIHWALNQPFSLKVGLGWGLLIAIFVLLALLIKIFFLPRLYEQLMAISTTETFQKRKRKTNQTIKQLLREYNLQLIKEPNIAMQVLTSSVVLPVVMLISSGTALKGLMGTGISNHFIGVVFIVGIFVAYMSCHSTSFVANLISLDRENYDFIQTLPLSKKDYLKQKFFIGFVIQGSITGMIMLVGGIYVKLSLLLLIVGLIGAFLGSLVMSMIYFARDYRLLMTNWTSVTQLFQRGGGTMLMGILMMGGLFLGLILIGAYAFLTAISPFAPLTPLVIGGVLLICGSILIYFKRRFWDQLES